VGPVQVVVGGRPSSPHAPPPPRRPPFSANWQRPETRGNARRNAETETGGEVPIKHGSSNGGLATQRAKEIALLAGSARAARGILARMFPGNIAANRRALPELLLSLAPVAAGRSRSPRADFWRVSKNPIENHVLLNQ